MVDGGELVVRYGSSVVWRMVVIAIVVACVAHRKYSTLVPLVHKQEIVISRFECCKMLYHTMISKCNIDNYDTVNVTSDD